MFSGQYFCRKLSSLSNFAPILPHAGGARVLRPVWCLPVALFVFRWFCFSFFFENPVPNVFISVQYKNWKRGLHSPRVATPRAKETSPFGVRCFQILQCVHCNKDDGLKVFTWYMSEPSRRFYYTLNDAFLSCMHLAGSCRSSVSCKVQCTVIFSFLLLCVHFIHLMSPANISANPCEHQDGYIPPCVLIPTQNWFGETQALVYVIRNQAMSTRDNVRKWPLDGGRGWGWGTGDWGGFRYRWSEGGHSVLP